MRLFIILCALYFGAPLNVYLPTTQSKPASAPESKPKTTKNSFEGVWKTSFGILRLSRDGARLRGSYTYASGSSIDGEESGRIFRAKYTEPTGAKGLAVFQLSEDGDSFEGVWNTDPEAPLELNTKNAKKWSGARAVPSNDGEWLIILEAHWESSLADHEFSYGAMLRAFFERLPNVKVRHRFMHDKADFLRFCKELGEITDPVVLYISSHGTEAGAQVGGDVLDGKMIGEAVRDFTNIKLLHFGSCSMLGGKLGARVREAAAPNTNFAISGFKVPVDWAGSAIVDFTYLDLIFEHKMSPADAVAKVRETITFARSPKEGAAPIAGTDLTIFEK